MAVHVQTSAQAADEPPTRIRLICLAHSRQQLMQYRQWADALSEPIELLAIDLSPAACLDSFDPTTTTLLDTLTKQLQRYLAQPHALFGQSLGAHVALALAQRVQRTWPGQTRHLFVAGCDSPNLATADCAVAIQAPMTVLYPAGALPAMLGWNRLASRGLELIELPAQAIDGTLFNQRIARIFNAHLGLLGF